MSKEMVTGSDGGESRKSGRINENEEGEEVDKLRKIQLSHGLSHLSFFLPLERDLAIYA
jgi:hypothetical protein